MKINIIKVLFAVAVGALLGYICKKIAVEANQWCSFAIAGITIIASLIASFAFYSNVSGPRSANTKLAAWIMAVLIVIANFVFAFTSYKQDTYIVIMALLLVIDLFIVYILARKKE